MCGRERPLMCHGLRELRLCPFDIPPRHHPPMITSIGQQGPSFGSALPRLFNPRERHAQTACHQESAREAECQLSTPGMTVN